MEVVQRANAPALVSRRGRAEPVRRVIDSWVYRSEWWRRERRRRYFLVELATGVAAELFQEGESWVLSRLCD